MLDGWGGLLPALSGLASRMLVVALAQEARMLNGESSMPFDPERLRALAEAKRARDDENAAREFAKFEADRLAAFLRWLNVELERIAEYGYLGATLHFKEGYGEGLGEGLGWDASVEPAANCADCGSSDSIRVGPQLLPIQQVAVLVMESVRKFGIKAESKHPLDADISLSW